MDSLPSASLPPHCCHTPYRARALSFTSLHFSLFASQAGSRSTDQGGCLGCIINYWPQAHAVPDRPGGEALCREIPPPEKKKKERRSCGSTSSISESISILMDFSDYSYCRCWIANSRRNSRHFPWRGSFPSRGCVRRSPVCLGGSSEPMWRACQGQCAAPA